MPIIMSEKKSGNIFNHLTVCIIGTRPQDNVSRKRERTSPHILFLTYKSLFPVFLALKKAGHAGAASSEGPQKAFTMLGG